MATIAVKYCYLLKSYYCVYCSYFTVKNKLFEVSFSTQISYCKLNGCQKYFGKISLQNKPKHCMIYYWACSTLWQYIESQRGRALSQAAFSGCVCVCINPMYTSGQFRKEVLRLELMNDQKWSNLIWSRKNFYGCECALHLKKRNCHWFPIKWFQLRY